MKMTSNYYKKNKEKLQKEAHERYKNLSKEEKDKKRQYAGERFRNLSEEQYIRIFQRMSIEKKFLESKK